VLDLKIISCIGNSFLDRNRAGKTDRPVNRLRTCPTKQFTITKLPI